MTLEGRVRQGMTTDADADLVAELVELACWAGQYAENRYARERGCRCWDEALANKEE